MNHINLDNYLVNYQVFFKKIKHMYLRYEDNIIKITCNKKVSQKAIELFIIKHKKWVLKHHLIEKFELYNRKYMFVWGNKYPVVIDGDITQYIKLDNHQIKIKDQSFNTKKIELFYKSLLLEEINLILNQNIHLIEPHIMLNDIIFKAQLMKSRLGSCIANKRIVKLNSLLARLDKKYMKLVLYHELVHLRISNHSKNFHVLLENIHPSHKELNRDLKKVIKSFVY